MKQQPESDGPDNTGWLRSAWTRGGVCVATFRRAPRPSALAGHRTRTRMVSMPTQASGMRWLPSRDAGLRPAGRLPRSRRRPRCVLTILRTRTLHVLRQHRMLRPVGGGSVAGSLTQPDVGRHLAGDYGSEGDPRPLRALRPSCRRVDSAPYGGSHGCIHPCGQADQEGPPLPIDGFVILGAPRPSHLG